MRFLPVVERELRVTARRPATYWSRFLGPVALIIVWIVFEATPSRMPHLRGQHLLTTLSLLTLAFAALAGVFLTADSISEERRDGTLGLLFLTDLKGYDIVLGKLAAAALNAATGLSAALPILALPLVMGGVTGIELFRIMLVLVVTLLFSLALGLAVSTFSQEPRQAMLGAFGLIILLSGVLPSLWWLQTVFAKFRSFDFLLWSSPVYGLLTAFDGRFAFRSGPGEFFRTITTLGAWAIGGFAIACFRTARIWQTSDAALVSEVSEVERTFKPRFRARMRTRLRSFPRIWLEVNPYFWRASRNNTAEFRLMELTKLCLGLWIMFWLGWLGTRDIAPYFIGCLFIAYAMHQVIKFAAAFEATRRFHEDRQSGALELLLVTPITIREIIIGEAKAQRNALLRPMFAAGAVNVALMFTVLIFRDELHMRREVGMFLGFFSGGLLLLWADIWAMRWVGMELALKSGKPHRAAFGTLFRILLPPWLALFLFMMVLMVGRGMKEDTASFIFGLWVFFGLALDLKRGMTARERLRWHFRDLAAQGAGSRG
jgi:ABC-type transport system involved in cytochrome c biogenesis permease component